MYGEWITLNLGDCFQVKVWVFCTPKTPKAEKSAMAIARLRGALGEPTNQPDEQQEKR